MHRNEWPFTGWRENTIAVTCMFGLMAGGIYASDYMISELEADKGCFKKEDHLVNPVFGLATFASRTDCLPGFEKR